ncbi:hypothetical protein OS493_006508 [Desmophyllum pertusum]|uniref:Uncharacterized protein n=1 Tax=Desmophyllum pertusum TaxID=174260 RepID=A0A9X0DD05_9CNID|nr:hypothetical protein OS493_006508 [Desmophyllum pertusum]
MDSRIVLALFYVFILAVPYYVTAQGYNCPFDYRCGKRQVNDEVTPPRGRLANRVRLLRNFHASSDEGRSMKEERGLGNIADTEGSWE